LPMRQLQAVLFDMDGTLCESESVWISAEFALARRNGATWTDEDGLALVGRDLLASGAYIKDRMGLTHTPAQVVDELIDGVVASVLVDGVEWRPGAVELLAACNAAALPTALVTMSYDKFASAVVSALPEGRFDAIVTGEMVREGKPAPDSYLLGAELLGVDPRSCVAIEDSPPGAAAAESAGCLVVTVPNHVKIPLTAARVEVASLVDVSPDGLRRLFAAHPSRVQR
jgi:beta-phosphoglucomutase-like phosphatase (HAD superfamily)